MKKLFLLFIIYFSAHCFAGSKYYFAKSGNDASGSGRKNNPYATISKLNALTLTAGDSVFFNRGDVFYGTVIIKNSGTISSKIYIGAYGTGAQPIITGLSPISTWTSVGRGLYTTKLITSSPGSLNMVTFQDKLQPIGRYPKAGLGENSYLKISAVNNGTNNGMANRSITSDNISGIPEFVGGELVQRTAQWVFDRSRVSNQNDRVITYDVEISPDHPTSSYGSIINHGFFFQNHVNTLTSIGDWAYDQNTKVLTMYFGNVSPSTFNVKVATLDHLLSISSQEYILIEDINFKGSNADAIILDYVNGIKFDRDSIQLAGQDGIAVSRKNSFLNTHHNTITNCTICNCLNSGLSLVQTTNWFISANHIYNIGLIQGMGLSGDAETIGIMRVGSNSIVEFNEIDNIGYHGIWYTGDNTIIRYNHVHHCMLKKSDGGGIYTVGVTGANRKVYNNIVHDNYADNYGTGIKDFNNPYQKQAHGIYNDDNSSNINETNNTLFNNGSSGLFFGSNTNITATGNTIYNNTTAQIKGIDRKGTYKNIYISNNILFAKDSGQLVLSFVFKDDNSMSGLFIDSNIYARPLWQPSGIKGDKGYGVSPFKWENYHNGAIIENASSNGFYSLDAWQSEKSKDLHSVTTPAPISSSKDVLFAYNASRQISKISIHQNYLDMHGVKYPPGTIELQPYTSIILIKQ